MIIPVRCFTCGKVGFSPTALVNWAIWILFRDFSLLFRVLVTLNLTKKSSFLSLSLSRILSECIISCIYSVSIRNFCFWVIKFWAFALWLPRWLETSGMRILIFSSSTTLKGELHDSARSNHTLCEKRIIYLKLREISPDFFYVGRLVNTTCLIEKQKQQSLLKDLACYDHLFMLCHWNRLCPCLV